MDPSRSQSILRCLGAIAVLALGLPALGQDRPGSDARNQQTEKQPQEKRLREDADRMKAPELKEMKFQLLLQEDLALQKGFGSEYNQVLEGLAYYALVMRVRGHTAEADEVEARVKSMREHTDYRGGNSYVDWLLLLQAENMEEELKRSPAEAERIRQLAPLRASEFEKVAVLMRKVNRETEAAKLEAAAKVIRRGDGSWLEKYAALAKLRNDEDAAIEKRYEDERFAEYVASLNEAALPGMKLNLTLQEQGYFNRQSSPPSYEYQNLIDALEKYATTLRLKGHGGEAKDIQARVNCMHELSDYAGPNSFADWLLAYRANALHFALEPLKNPTSEAVVKNWESTREWLPLELETLAASLRKVNRTTEAVKLEEQAKAIRRLPADHP